MAAANTTNTATAAAEPEPLPQLKYQTWVLKVSIHCKGCQRKVKRVLQAIEGVYTTEVDLKQHKVTVTGDVDADTLIRKLHKSGKQAELWPDMKPPLPKQTKDAAGVASDVSDEGSDDDDHGVCEGHPSHLHNVDMATPVSHVDFGKGVQAISAVNLVPLVVDKLSVSDGRHPSEKPPNAAQGSGAVAGAKKKKKKKKKKSNVTFAAAGSATIDGKPAVQTAVAMPPVVLPPHVCTSPVGFAASPAYQARPVYAVSYSVSQPSTSYTTTSYYAPTPATACMTPTPMAAYESPASGYSSESYHIFSDENANACSVM